jgi:glutamyl/glutaminyl-tRNA synthetase
LIETLGGTTPDYCHGPLLTDGGGKLSKRLGSLSTQLLRETDSPEQIIGRLAFLCGLRENDEPASARELLADFDWAKVSWEDIRIDTYRSSGAGGQHINKTSSAIRITHFPTGIVVTCQNERSQFQNKDKAMQMLKAKLYMLKQQENAEKLSDIRGDVKDINFGNQIRSYVMQPYTLVKDHRTNAENGNIQAVMDGDIDYFISEYLKWISLKSGR